MELLGVVTMVGETREERKKVQKYTNMIFIHKQDSKLCPPKILAPQNKRENLTV